MSETFGFEILIVEDNPPDIAIIRDALRNRKPPGVDVVYRISEAEGIDEAERKLRARRFDLVLLDLTLPKITGLDTYRAAKGMTTAPIAILTGLNDMALAADAVRVGAYQYILKDWLIDQPALIHFLILPVIELARRAGKIEAMERERLQLQTPLIAACSICQNWRDEASGEWLTPQYYIERLTDIRLSHGICPGCAAARYPDLMDQIRSSE